MGYEVPQVYIERYADLLINYALGGGAGISAGDLVRVTAAESAKPLYAALCRAVWRAGGNVLGDYRPDDETAAENLTRDFVTMAAPEQVSFLAERYWKGMLDDVDHMLMLDCDADPRALAEVDPAPLLDRQEAMRPVLKWREEKENAGRLSWTIALYGTEAMAHEAGLSLAEYWEQIIAACFLDAEDPKVKWREVERTIATTVEALDALPIDTVRVRGADADLTITLGEHRRWIGGGGRNIPSFEVFTSPDWRGTEGWIRFSEPLYTHGTLVTGVELTFADGVVTRATAAENESLLTEIVSAPNGDKVGEFSLTDGRLSRITRFMATTLFDENTGGRYGNTHLAVGRALSPCYAGDPAALEPEDWARLGFNDSVVHTDIVSTTDREVTATLHDGTERVIYADGRFQVDG